jgi:lysophospholipase L1-like esterase
MTVLKKILWFSLLLLSLAGTIALSIGFYQALTLTGPSSGPDAAPTARNDLGQDKGGALPEKGNAVSLLIIGDSIARGAGDETGKGFLFYLPEDLKNKTPKEVVVNNVGIDGLQTDGLVTMVQGEKLKPAIAAADLVLISIGGNDLRHIRRLSDETKEEGFQKTFDTYATGLKTLLKTLRKANADALIIFLGLYYPSVQESSPDDTRLLLAWNEGTQKIIEQAGPAIFIPTYDLFKLNAAKYVAPDALHPNAAGYQAMAGRIGKNIEGVLNQGPQTGPKSN